MFVIALRTFLITSVGQARLTIQEVSASVAFGDLFGGVFPAPGRN